MIAQKLSGRSGPLGSENGRLMMIDFEQLTPISEIDRGDPNDEESLGVYHERAREFLLSHHWCKSVSDSYLGMAYEGILAVFLLEIVPNQQGVDEFLWVIVGDIPPAYLVCDHYPRAQDALDGYVYYMREWVEAVQSGTSTAKILPVNAPETEEYAGMLKSRLDFIEKEILSIE